MRPNLSNYLLNRVLLFTVDRKKQKSNLCYEFSSKKPFSVLGQFSTGVKGDRVHRRFFPQCTLSPSVLFQGRLHHSLSLSTSMLFLLLCHSLFQHVVPFPTLPSSNISILSILQAHLLCHFLHETFPNSQASCYLSFL